MRTPIGSSALAPPGLRRRRLTVGAAAALALLTLALLSVGCGSSGGNAGSKTKITVFAAASLTEAFTKLGADFTAAHPGVTVAFNFAGSQVLATQIGQGAPADIFASAAKKNMDAVASLVGTPRTFADNKLEIVVAKGDPLGIRSLADLSKASLKVVLEAPSVPAGKYARQALDALHITVKPVSLEDNVKAVVTKVSMGEADAGIVYVTDVKAAAGSVDGVQIPAAQNVVAHYPIAVVKASKHARDAQAFVDYVLSDAGQQTLRGFGFLPPSP